MFSFFFSNFNPLISLIPFFLPKYTHLFNFFPRILSLFVHVCYSLHDLYLFDRKIMKAPDFSAWHISLIAMHVVELSRELRHFNIFQKLSLLQYFAPLFQKFLEEQLVTGVMSAIPNCLSFLIACLCVRVCMCHIFCCGNSCSDDDMRKAVWDKK